MKIEIYGVTVPAKYEVCPYCQGQGVQDCFRGGFTSEQAEEWGQEFIDDYMEGVYNKRCEECNGKRVQAVIDRDRCTPEQLTAYDKAEKDHLDYEAECAAEARYFGRFG